MIFGRWTPLGSVAAALLFGFSYQLQTELSVLRVPVSSFILLMAPYVATIIAVAGLVGTGAAARRRRQAVRQGMTAAGVAGSAADPYQAAQASAARLAELTGAAPARRRRRPRLRLGARRRRPRPPPAPSPARRRSAGSRRRRCGGHSPAVRSLLAGQVRALVFLGRVHLYEGHPVATVVHGVRTAVAAGCQVVVLTNAAGGISAGYQVGQPVLIARPPQPDRPLAAGRPAAARRATRRVSPTSPTCTAPRLRALARRSRPGPGRGRLRGAARARTTRRRPRSAMLRTLGADLVGMSTVLEAIAARHLGAEVLGHLAGQQPGGGAGRRTGSTTARWSPPGRRRPAGWARCWRACCPVAAGRRGTIGDRRRPARSGRALDRRRPGRAGPRRAARPARRRRCRRPRPSWPTGSRGRLEFGTAGLRGAVGAGPNRMNRAVVRAATAALAGWLRRARRRARPEAGVVIGCDARHRSASSPTRRPGCSPGAGIGVHLLPPAAADPAARLRRPAPAGRGRDHDHGQPQPARRQRLQALPGRRRADHPAGGRADRGGHRRARRRCPRSRSPPRTAR